MASKRVFRSPLRYPGGKTCLYKFMTSLMVENDFIGINYAEPYAGGAGLALKLLMDEYVNEIFINDLDPSIYSFWYIILNRPDEFCRWIEDVPVNVEQWYIQKKIQLNYKTADIMDLAKSTFFLNRTNVSGVISGGVIGGLRQKGKYKIDVRFKKDELINRILEISKFSRRIHLFNLNGIVFVSKLEKLKQNILFYLDPPYYKKGSYLYMNSFSENDHKELATIVKKMRNNWIVSYDNQEFVRQLYSDKCKVLYQLSQCTSNRVGDEILIFDDRIHFNESKMFLNNSIDI